MSAHRGVHQAVLLEEAVAALHVRADGVYVDATFGRGGHSRAILAQLGPGGRLLAIDRDPAAIAAAKHIEDARFAAVHAGFAALGEVLDAKQLLLVDGIVLDLGV